MILFSVGVILNLRDLIISWSVQTTAEVTRMARLSSDRFEILTDSIISQLQKKGIYTDFDFMEKAVDTLVNFSGLSFKVSFIGIIEIITTFSDQFFNFKFDAFFNQN